MIKSLFFLLLLIVYSESKEWDKQLPFSLKKDEVKTFLFKKDEKVFKLEFAWTLYKDGALVLNIEYNKDRYSPVLLNSFGHNAFKIDLFTKGRDSKSDILHPPYLLIFFDAFDKENKRAFFNLNIKDYGVSEVYDDTKGER